MHKKLLIVSLFTLAAAALLVRPLHAQALYSYTDDSGVRVFTNMAPVQPVDDLIVTGAVSSPYPSHAQPKSIDGIIEKYATHYQLDPSLIRSIIETESNFNPKAVSPKGARGLMQLMPATAQRLGVENSFDPEQNIEGGVKHFRSLLDTFDNNLVLSLAAYNAGENLVQRLGRVPEIKETRDYVKLVTQRYGKTELDMQDREEKMRRQTFRFVDDSGILHLTNIPPRQ
jgi:soluble lytic murein transglycosylase-like protein